MGDTYFDGVDVSHTVSRLVVDQDLDMGGYDIDIGAGAILTTDLALVQKLVNKLGVTNRAQTLYQGVEVSFLRSTDITTGEIDESVLNAGVIVEGLTNKDGSLQGFDAMTDAAAANDTLYKASDHANVLYYKDSGGTSHALW